MARLSNGSIVQWATEYVVTVVVVLFILFPSHSRRRAVTSKVPRRANGTKKKRPTAYYSRMCWSRPCSNIVARLSRRRPT
jgi:hypothetical protein